MYGSQLWDMESEKADAMLTQWKIAHRIILGIPYDAHNDILPLIANNMPLKCILDCKFISFYKAISASENKMVNYMVKARLYKSSSTFGRNMGRILRTYELNIEDIIFMNKNKIKDFCYRKWMSNISVDYQDNARVIRDMINMKEERCTRIFMNEDCNRIMEILSTT